MPAMIGNQVGHSPESLPPKPSCPSTTRKPPSTGDRCHADHVTGMHDMSTPHWPKKVASFPLETDLCTCSYTRARSSTSTAAQCHPTSFKTCCKKLCMRRGHKVPPLNAPPPPPHHVPGHEQGKGQGFALIAYDRDAEREEQDEERMLATRSLGGVCCLWVGRTTQTVEAA